MLPQRVKLPSEVQWYPPQSIILHTRPEAFSTIGEQRSPTSLTRGLPGVSPAQEVICGVGLMRSSQAVSQPCGKLPNGEQHSAASSPALQVGSRTAGPVDFGEQLSTASLPAPQVGSHTARPADNGKQLSAAFSPALQASPASPDQIDIGEQHSAASSPTLQDSPALPDQIDNGKQHSAASSPALQAGPASPDQWQRRAAQRRLFACTAGWSCTAKSVPHWSSSCAATSCLSTLLRALAVSAAKPVAQAQGFGGLLYLRDRRSEVSLKIWQPRPAPASLTPSLRGVLWRAALYVHSS